MTGKDLIGVRVYMTQTLLDKVEHHCTESGIENRSEFIRNAITKALTPDVSDAALKFESLKQLHDKEKVIEKDLEILLNYLSFFVKYYMLYAEDVPEEMKQAAAKNASIKYEKFITGFKKSLKNNPALFESLLADQFESREEK